MDVVLGMVVCGVVGWLVGYAMGYERKYGHYYVPADDGFEDLSWLDEDEEKKD